MPPEDNSSMDATAFLSAADANLAVRKKSLVAKLDDLKRTGSPQTFATPNASFTSRSSRDSPLASYLRTAALCSTPKSSTSSSNNNYDLCGGGAGDAPSPAATSSPFDGRTFTRNRPSPTRYRLTLDQEASPPRAANLTFDLDSGGGGGGANATFTASPHKRNATFEIEEPRLVSWKQSLDMSHSNNLIINSSYPLVIYP